MQGQTPTLGIGCSSTLRVQARQGLPLLGVCCDLRFLEDSFEEEAAVTDIQCAHTTYIMAIPTLRNTALHGRRLTDMLEQTYRDDRSRNEGARQPKSHGNIGHAQQHAPCSTALILQAPCGPPTQSRLPPVMRAAALKQRQVRQSPAGSFIEPMC